MYLRIILLILLPIFGFSQAPQKINFQSILRNTNGEVVGNKAVSLRISILSGSITGNTVYSETHIKTTDASGLISLKIGTGSILKGGFDSIKWGIAAHFIKLEIDFNGGNNFVLLGTQELMSVPYALYANRANVVDSLVGGLSSNELVNQLKILQSHFTVFDIDGNKYNFVKVGNQVWMAENLRVSHYRNGDLIQIVTDNSAWGALTTGGRCWYSNDSTTYENSYGNLYNWYAVADSRGLCPTGWHVPTDAEWTILIQTIDPTQLVNNQNINSFQGYQSLTGGGKMKQTGTSLWNSPNTGATNESGFSALPGGYRNSVGSFEDIRNFAFFWSATEFNPNIGWYRSLYNFNGGVLRNVYSPNKSGYSVRCLRD